MEQSTLFIPNPKGGADRGFTLPLSQFLNTMLKTRRKENEILFPNSPWVFPAQSVSGHVEEPRKKGLPAPHAYRHTYRTLSLEAGIPYTEVSLLLNHKVQTVSFGYISRSAIIEHLREQQEKMTSFLLDAIHTIPQPNNGAEDSNLSTPSVIDQSLLHSPPASALPSFQTPIFL